MRFVYPVTAIVSVVLTMLALTFWAAPVPVSAQNETATQRQAGQSDVPTAPDGFTLTRYNAGLGPIDAVAVSNRNELFVLSQTRGTITVISDRNQDGRVDMRRILPVAFDHPSDVIWHKNTLYVSDREAVWRLNPDGSAKMIVARLSNVAADQTPRPLSMNPTGDTLVLGLNFGAAPAKLYRIDIITGRAEVISQGSGTKSGPVTAIAHSPSGQIWVGANGFVINVREETFGQETVGAVNMKAAINDLSMDAFAGNASFGADLLPDRAGQENTSPPTYRISDLEKLDHGKSGHIVVALGAGMDRTSGFSVQTLNTAYGELSETPEPYLSGFLDPRRKSSWGNPVAIVPASPAPTIQFLADGWNGTIWRVAYSPPAQHPKAPIKTDENRRITLPDDQVLLRSDDDRVDESGNGRAAINTDPRIPAGSLIKQGSMITTGSTRVEEWEAEREERRQKRREKRESTESADESGDETRDFQPD